MTIQKYSINNLFKLTVIISIIFVTSNSVLASDPNVVDLPQLNSVENSQSKDTQNDPNSGKDSGAKTIDTKSVSNDGDEAEASGTKEPSKSNNPEVLVSQDIFKAKNILLLFAIIDLPILALLLTLWFLDRKEQKQKFDHLINGQIKIDRKLKQLDKITLKLEDLDKLQNKIAKDIEQNKQVIIDSRIKLLAAFEKKQSKRSVNSNGNTDIRSNNYHNVSDFNKEPAEHQLDKHSHNQVAVIEKIPQFVDTYNLDKKFLSDEVIATVSATETSLNERRLGKSDILTLEPTTQKKYWIVQEDDYYLVPHAKIKIDEYNKTTLESLFECINFSSDYEDFHLIEPAKVSLLESELWQLEKKGKLEFS